MIKNMDKNKTEFQGWISEITRRQARHLERNLALLGTIASITPLLGLLGTVTGMIRVFYTIASRGIGEPSALAGGIGEALITTAAGLTVAIPSLIFYNYFLTKVDSLLSDLEEASLETMEILLEERRSEDVVITQKKD